MDIYTSQGPMAAKGDFEYLSHLAHATIGLTEQSSLERFGLYMADNVSSGTAKRQPPKSVWHLHDKQNKRKRGDARSLNNGPSTSTLYARYSNLDVSSRHDDTVSRSIFHSGPQRLLVFGHITGNHPDDTYASADQCTVFLSDPADQSKSERVYQIDRVGLTRHPLSEDSEGKEDITLQIQPFEHADDYGPDGPSHVVFRGTRVDGGGTQARENSETWFGDAWIGRVVSEATDRPGTADGPAQQSVVACPG